MAMMVKKTRPLTIAAPRWCNQTCWRRHIILSVQGLLCTHPRAPIEINHHMDGIRRCRRLCHICVCSCHLLFLFSLLLDQSHIVLSATSSMRRECHESVMSSVTN